MDGAATSVNDHTSSDDTSMSLLVKDPMDVETYYETICKIQPLARRNFIVEELWLVKGPNYEGKYEFIVAKVKHLRGHDISDLLEYLVIEKIPHSSIGSSSSAKHIVSQSREVDGNQYFRMTRRRLMFDTSSNSNNNRKLCLLEELFRLIAIISKNSHLYSTDIDASFWFAATIMETAQAIFHCDDTGNESGWFKRTFLSSRPQSECGRQIVVAYKADKKKASDSNSSKYE